MRTKIFSFRHKHRWHIAPCSVIVIFLFVKKFDATVTNIINLNAIFSWEWNHVYPFRHCNCFYFFTLVHVLKYLILQTSGDTTTPEIKTFVPSFGNTSSVIAPLSHSVAKPLRVTNALYLTYFWIDNFQLALNWESSWKEVYVNLICKTK